jgi:hypothetical protein
MHRRIRSERASRKWNKRRSCEEQEVKEDRFPIDPFYKAEEGVMILPHDAYYGEAETVCDEVRPQAQQG